MPPSYSNFCEDQTRYNLIDPLLEKAGWKLADRRVVSFEIPVDGCEGSPINSITDYFLYSSNGEALAVIEAIRTRRDARAGKEQIFEYITEIEQKHSFRPFRILQ